MFHDLKVIDRFRDIYAGDGQGWRRLPADVAGWLWGAGWKPASRGKVPAGSRQHEGRCRLEAGITGEGAGWKPASRGLFLGDVDGVAVAFEEGVFAGVFKV
jgi:hypothetical protein